jgi:hypothetical protein
MRTGFFAIETAIRRPTPLASIAGRFHIRGDAGNGWLLGWWDHALVLVRASTQEAIRLGEREGRGPNQLAMADKLVAASFWALHGSTVGLYSIERPD